MKRIPTAVARAVTLAMLAVWPATMSAQLVSTGAQQVAGRDSRWEAFFGLNWQPAYVVTSLPGQWTSGAPGGTWISVSPSGSGGPSPYAVRSQFTLNAGDQYSFDFRCATDNLLIGAFINGVQFGGNHCPNIWSWGSFTNVPASSFVVGLNTLEFRWSGDQTTDGIAIEIANGRFVPGSVVPEPSSILLMAAGLAGLGLVARRKVRRT